MNDKEQRVKALTRLGVATREKLEPQTFAVYLDDTAWIETKAFVEACRRLETIAQWFPKVAELMEMCRLVAKEYQLRAEADRPRLSAPPEPSPERIREHMANIKAACFGRAKSMPSADVPSVDGRTLRRVK